jgi:UDP-N-acetylglucosamine:LPS N-acetylglucosamine transferase
VVISDSELTPERLADQTLDLLRDGSALARMAEAARALAKPDAAGRIAREVLAAVSG